MKKKSLFVSAAGLATLVLTACGGNNSISTADAKAIAKKFDERGEDIVMSSQTIKATINSFSFSGNGIIGYYNPDEGITLSNYHINNAAFSIDKQDIVDISIPNTLLDMLTPVLGQSKKFTSIPYLLSATISEKMIDAYTSYVDVSGKEKGWENLKTTFTKKTTKNNNECLSAALEISNITKFTDEYAAAGFELTDIPFKGDGSFKASVSSDELGYINNLSFAVKGSNITIDEGYYKEENENEIDPGVVDPFFKAGTKITGCNITGNCDINISLDVVHNEATQKTVKFYRQNKKWDADNEKWVNDGDTVEITDLEKDEIIEFASIQPVKTDPLVKKTYFGKKNIAYDGISYNIGFKVKDGKNYHLADSEEDNNYSLSYGGFVVNIKPQTEMFDFAYRYFYDFDYEYDNGQHTFEGADKLYNKGYKTFHCGKNLISELGKLGEANLEITINAYEGAD